MIPITQKEIHTPYLSPRTTPAVSCLPDLPMSLAAAEKLCHPGFFGGTQAPKLLGTLRPSHFLCPLPAVLPSSPFSQKASLDPQVE